MKCNTQNDDFNKVTLDNDSFELYAASSTSTIFSPEYPTQAQSGAQTGVSLCTELALICYSPRPSYKGEATPTSPRSDFCFQDHPFKKASPHASSEMM